MCVCVLNFTCRNTCAYRYTDTRVHVEARQKPWLVLLRHHQPFSQRQSLSFVWTLARKLGWLVRKSQRSSCLRLPGGTTNMYHHTWLFKHGFWGLNLAPYDCRASTFQVEPPLQPFGGALCLNLTLGLHSTSFSRSSRKSSPGTPSTLCSPGSTWSTSLSYVLWAM